MFSALDGITPPPSVIVHGGCQGVDLLAAHWASERGVKHEEHVAAWSRYGGAAGPIRNKHMADLGADLCVAFPGGNGTRHMVRTARSAGISVMQVC